MDTRPLLSSSPSRDRGGSKLSAPGAVTTDKWTRGRDLHAVPHGIAVAAYAECSRARHRAEHHEDTGQGLQQSIRIAVETTRAPNGPRGGDNGGREHTFPIGMRARGASAVASPPCDDFPFECNIIPIHPGYTNKTRPCDVHAPHGVRSANPWERHR